MLHPHQMNNKVYINLKKNLEDKILNRCFSKYGYIIKIIEILGYNDGIIECENPQSAALFDISFSCRLCAPLKNMQIICKIDRVNKLLVTAINGPILVVITNDRINNEIFFKDNNNNIRYKKEGLSNILMPEDFIRVTLQSIKFFDGDEKIKAIGFIDDMATEPDKQKFYSETYNTESAPVLDYEKYIEAAI